MDHARSTGSVVKAKVIAIEAGQAMYRRPATRWKARVELKEFAEAWRSSESEVGDRKSKCFLRQVENSRGEAVMLP